MRCFSLRAVAVLLCSVVLVCGPLAIAQTSSRETKPNAELLKADRDFFAALKARKLEGWMEFMSEETTLFRDKPYTGLQAIRANVAGDFNDSTFSLTWDPETAVLLESAKWATPPDTTWSQARTTAKPTSLAASTSRSGRSRRTAPGKSSGTAAPPPAQRSSRVCICSPEKHFRLPARWGG